MSVPKGANRKALKSRAARAKANQKAASIAESASHENNPTQAQEPQPAGTEGMAHSIADAVPAAGADHPAFAGNWWSSYSDSKYDPAAAAAAAASAVSAATSACLARSMSAEDKYAAYSRLAEGVPPPPLANDLEAPKSASSRTQGARRAQSDPQPSVHLASCHSGPSSLPAVSSGSAAPAPYSNIPMQMGNYVISDELEHKAAPSCSHGASRTSTRAEKQEDVYERDMRMILEHCERISEGTSGYPNGLQCLMLGQRPPDQSSRSNSGDSARAELRAHGRPALHRSRPAPHSVIFRWPSSDPASAHDVGADSGASTTTLGTSPRHSSGPSRSSTPSEVGSDVAGRNHLRPHVQAHDQGQRLSPSDGAPFRAVSPSDSERACAHLMTEAFLHEQARIEQAEDPDRPQPAGAQARAEHSGQQHVDSCAEASRLWSLVGKSSGSIFGLQPQPYEHDLSAQQAYQPGQDPVAYQEQHQSASMSDRQRRQLQEQLRQEQQRQRAAEERLKEQRLKKNRKRTEKRKAKEKAEKEAARAAALVAQAWEAQASQTTKLDSPKTAGSEAEGHQRTLSPQTLPSEAFKPQPVSNDQRTNDATAASPASPCAKSDNTEEDEPPSCECAALPRSCSCSRAASSSRAGSSARATSNEHDADESGPLSSTPDTSSPPSEYEHRDKPVRGRSSRAASPAPSVAGTSGVETDSSACSDASDSGASYLSAPTMHLADISAVQSGDRSWMAKLDSIKADELFAIERFLEDSEESWRLAMGEQPQYTSLEDYNTRKAVLHSRDPARTN